jgi:outer membrane protein assembly factor BamA
MGGNFSPVVLKQANNRSQLAFVSYYKGNYELHGLDKKDPVVTASTSDFGAPGPIIDFQAPIMHTLVATNARKKGTFEKMFLDGRPPVNVGVTSSGNVYGGSAVNFSDVLGDKQINFYAQSISQYRTLSFSFIDLSKRFNWALQGYSQTLFFYGQLSNVFYDPLYSGFIDRSLAQATTTLQGGTAFGIYPMNRYRRLELSAGLLQYKQSFNDPSLQQTSDRYQQAQFGRSLLQNGYFMPLGAALVEETTVFREFGPLAGRTMRLSYEVAPKIGNSLSRQTLDADVRHYTRIGTTGLLALRLRGFRSWGQSPNFIYFGGNSELRGYNYLEFLGSRTAFANAELRFPFIEAMLTPIGVMGGVRGVFFAGMGGAYFDGQSTSAGQCGTNLGSLTLQNASTFTTSRAGSFTWWKSGASAECPITYSNVTGLPQLGKPVTVNGFRLVDSRASYGVGLESFFLGFPVHFDWSWRTLLNKNWEDVLFAADGGSAKFRKPRFAMWIGYDF